MRERQKPVIKCLAYFDAADSNDNRMNNPASFTKCSYIFSCFERLGYDVEILSASYVVGKKRAKGKKLRLSDNITLKTLSSMGRGNKFKNKIGMIFFALNLMFHLLFFVKKGDTLWAYHSLGLMRYLAFLKKIKDFRLILEVEEIYNDVTGDRKSKEKELGFCACADAYIFCTRYLGDEINKEGKPQVITHGTYKSEKDFNFRFSDNKKHVVYAGTFDPRKGGALAAVGAAEFLSDDYRMHILGFGKEEDVNKLIAEIDSVNKVSGCEVSYDGQLSGEEYKAFLQKCHIGLSTQNPSGGFNNSSFPSKILTYMANGLRVVSVRIPVVEDSSVNSLMYYYNEQTAEEIAKAIKSVDFNEEYNSREFLKDIDERCLEDLAELLKV